MRDRSELFLTKRSNFAAIGASSALWQRLSFGAITRTISQPVPVWSRQFRALPQSHPPHQSHHPLRHTIQLGRKSAPLGIVGLWVTAFIASA